MMYSLVKRQLSLLGSWSFAHLSLEEVVDLGVIHLEAHLALPSFPQVLPGECNKGTR